MGVLRIKENLLLDKKRNEIMLSYILKFMLVLATIWACMQKDNFLIFSALLSVIAILMPALISKKWHLVLPLEIDLIVTAFIIVHFLLGEIGEFYIKYWWFDLLLHSYSGFIIGLIGFIWSYMLFSVNNVKSQPWFIATFSMSLAMAVGTIWEIFEFSMDQLFGFKCISQDL
jgi:hypothetical protein